MANDQSGIVWYIDTPQVTPYPSQVYVRSINWAGMALNATLTMKDRFGRIIYDLVATSANESINPPMLGWVDGLYVSNISSGHVQIAVNK